MKTLEDHVILYDDECPACVLYTSGFVKAGMLNENGRMAFSESNEQIKTHVNISKACDEIALVNVKTGSTVYGIDSLMLIIANSFPPIKPLFKIPVFHWVAKKLYSLVSYNRKVIIPPTRTKATSCTPSFNLKYRLLYIILTWLVTSSILSCYTTLLNPLVPASNFYREFLICGGQIIFQGTFLMAIDRAKIVSYLGNMMTISFAGALLLSIVLPLQGIIHEPLFFLGWFLIVVLLMMAEHLRRTKLLQLPLMVTASWVVYRLLILTLIFTLG